MSSDNFAKGLRFVTFVVAVLVSLVATSSLLRNPLGRGIIGVVLFAGVFAAILYACSKYLKVLWVASDRFSAFIVSSALKPVRPFTQPMEEAQ